MDRRTDTDFTAIEQHIRNARLERSVALGALIARAAHAIGRGLRRLGQAMAEGYEAERDARAIEADAFLKRSVPRY